MRWAVILIVCVVVVVGSATLWAADGDLPGSGTEGDPYLIEDLADFDEFADSANSDTYWASGVYTRLDCDPNLAGRIYSTAVIALDTDNTTSTYEGVAFEGVFDGNDHIIKNLTIETQSAGNDYLGLFGWIRGSDARVDNLGIANVTITGGDDSWYLGGLCGLNEGKLFNCNVHGHVNGEKYVGGLCGHNDHGSIGVCYTNTTVLSRGDSSYVGGLCGRNNEGIICGCYSTGIVNGGGHIGGLVGSEYQGYISACYSSVEVTGSRSRVGGLVGSVTYGNINSCYANCSVEGLEKVGGLVGYNVSGKINNCYSMGTVKTQWRTGGLIGRNDAGTVRNCYSTVELYGNAFVGANHWNGEITGCFYDVEISNQPAYIPGEGKTTAEMQMLSTFTNAGWDFTHVWEMPENDYPRLRCNQDLPPYSGGSGTNAEPYLISSIQDWDTFIIDLRNRGSYYRLTNDIHFSTVPIMAVGSTSIPFFGVFDGQGHVLYNVIINNPNDDYIGLFGYLKHPGRIHNLGAEDVVVSGRKNVGGLCGGNSGGMLNDCYVTGEVSGYWGYCGGLCGSNGGTITNCFSTAGLPISTSYNGGLCGSNSNGTIIECYASGDVSGSSSCGGLVGVNKAIIRDCYATGAVTGRNFVGGLAGNNDLGSIAACYATGAITGQENVGGLVGNNDLGSITACYATGAITGQENVGGLVGKSQHAVGDDDYHIVGCYASGTVTTGDKSENIGGLVGFCDNTVIFNCYSNSSILLGSESKNAGGLVGYHSSTIINCYSSGTFVTGEGSEKIGGLTGYNNMGGMAANSYWDLDVSGINISSGGIGKTTLEMKQLATYMGWGENGTWVLDEGMDYPRLRIEGGPGEVIECPDFASGDGTASNPYRLATSHDLRVFGRTKYYWDKNFVLENDIVIGEVPANDLCMFFSGVFDGNGHVIKGITIESIDQHFGLLRVIDEVGEVRNLGMEGVDISGLAKAGRIAGGIAGENRGLIKNCYSTGNISGSYYIGGICGVNEGGTITDSYSTCSAQGGYYVGGLVGRNDRGAIVNCYSIGSGEGISDVGGLVGNSYYSSVWNSYWDMDTSGLIWSAGGAGLATGVMKEIGTFVGGGWDFVGEDVNGGADVWRMCLDGVGYPRLSWEYSAGGDFACGDGVGFEDVVYLCERWLMEDEFAGAADGDGNGVVDFGDFGILVEHFLEE